MDGKFAGLLFCTDLDGTLYSNDKTVSKENLEAIEYFKSQGGIFTFITGRVPITSKSICQTIKPNAPFGCLNGGGIYDYEQDKLLWSITLPETALLLAGEVYKRLPEIAFQVNTEKAVNFCRDNSAMAYFRKVTGVPNIQRHYSEIKEPILKIVFASDDAEQIALLTELLNSHPLAPHFDFIRSERRLYEMLPKGASKGALLCKMKTLLGAEKTIAVGDYNNDVSMIKAADLGFAVENAVEEARAAADYITVDNNHSAIAEVINGLDKGIFKF